jgi:molybdenum cofactor cytidylyltransferase
MTDSTLFAMVLAAGESRRFGATKQLAPHAGLPLVAHAMSAAEAVCGPNTLLVTGNEWRNVTAACGHLQGFLLRNTAFREGLSSSIRAGVRRLSAVADGVLIILADQPLITAGHLEQLLWQWRNAPDKIVASAYADSFGPPVIFPRDCFAELGRLRGDHGAKSIISRHSDRLISVNCPDAAIDIDRPTDLQKL